MKIGISACFSYPDPNRPYFSPKTLSYLENNMAQYLSRRGVMPILIPDLETGALEEYLLELDGFVFPGGSDIAPASYGETPIDPKKWPGDPYRDAYELKILDFAVCRGKPVLGICRGCQLINIYFGGTLYQDLQTQRERSLVHRDAASYDKVHHPVELTPHGMLANIYANTSLNHVNSVHHQGIKDVGKNLQVEAISPEDQLIEAIAYRPVNEKLILGVQWHPEFSATLGNKVIPPEPLYDFFLERVKRG